jgi:hypothetical protein
MINQISHVKTKTEPLPTINRGLMQTRRIQAKLKERIADGLLPSSGLLWVPGTPEPHFVQVTRWVE